MTFDNPLGYILSISMHMQNSQTVQGQNLHKLSGDKIKCLIIGHSMKFNFKFQLTFLGSCNFTNLFFFFFFFSQQYCSIHQTSVKTLIMRCTQTSFICILQLRMQWALKLFYLHSSRQYAVYTKPFICIH